MISRWEKGSRFPSPVNIFRLAALYHTMADALYFDLIIVVRKEIQARRNALEAGGEYCRSRQFPGLDIKGKIEQRPINQETASWLYLPFANNYVSRITYHLGG